MRTREQDRSRECWEALVESFGEDSAAWQNGSQGERNYLAALKKTASRIYVSGLGPAIAFLRSRNAEPPKHVAKDIGKLVLGGMGQNEGDDSSEELIRVLREAPDVATVAWATEEALAACTWLMRYLEGAGVSPSEDEE